MAEMRRVYLDNAATSWPKPCAVYDAVDGYQRHVGAAAGRGSYKESQEVDDVIQRTRATIAHFIGVENAARLIFTINCTDALNIVIHGLLRHGNHVVTTVAEHNSVLRPLKWLEEHGRITVSRVPCDERGMVKPQDIESAITGSTRLVVLTHASNVTGAIQPVEEVGRIARAHGALILLDGAQTLGHIPLNVEELCVDFLAAAGHKGLLGPLGTGILYIREGLDDVVESVRQGGTGSASFDDHQPSELPRKFEPGNMNVPGIFGLSAAVDILVKRGINEIERYESCLTRRLLERLSEIRGVRIHGPSCHEPRVGVVSITVRGVDSLSVAAALESEYRVQVRAGFHCAALIHDTIDSRSSKGTIRFSVGMFNTEEDVDRAADAVHAIVHPRVSTVAIPESIPCVMAASKIAGLEPVAPLLGILEVIPGLANLWNLTRGDPEIRIALLDGPVDITHPCFRGANLTRGAGVTSDSASSGPAGQHGTKVASLIFGQHHSDIKGIAPNCKGILIPIFQDSDRLTIGACPQPELAQAILTAAEAGAHIINISGGEVSPSGTAHPILSEAVAKCVERGILIVAAAGNQGCDCLHIPGALPSVLVVGAMDSQGEPKDFSNWGYGSEGVMAIGEGLRAAAVGGGTSIVSGTSFATPIVAGVAALMMSTLRRRGIPHTANLIREAILSTAEDCFRRPTERCDRLLAGRLDIDAALRYIIPEGLKTMDNHESDQTQTVDPAQVDPACFDARRSSEAPSPQGSPSTRSEINARPAGFARQPPATGISAEPTSPSSSDGRRTPPREETTILGVAAAACDTCNGARGALQKVFALGKLDFDYGTRQRRAYFANEFLNAGLTSIDNAKDLISYLKVRAPNPPGPATAAKYTILDEGAQFANRAKVTSITWTLKLDDTPIYAIQPSGAFAHEIHDTLVAFLQDQVDPKEKAERISIAGVIAGQARLFTGETVPVIVPDIRGMYCWSTSFLSSAATEAATARQKGKEHKGDEVDPQTRLDELLNRIYFEFENMGLTSEERALNFAVTDAMQLQGVLQSIVSSPQLRNLQFDSLEVVRSPICRPDSDCWDVKLFFFDPVNMFTTARRVFRFTVDVSDVVPVMIGSRREWATR